MAPFIITLLAALPIVFFIGFSLGHNDGWSDGMEEAGRVWRHEAVEGGHGYWEVDAWGDSKFRWKGHETKEASI